jgi:CHAT domain-containing protein
MGDYKTADSFFHLEFPIRVSGLSTNFSWLSAKEKEAYWQQEEPFFNRLNTFAGNTSMAYPPSTVLSFNAGLISKSLLLESSRELATAIAQSKDETLKLNYSEMIQLRRLYQEMQSEGSDQRELMDRYLKQADSLDKILVLSLGVYAESKRKFETTWKDVQSGLSASEVAIEFGRYFDKADSLNRYMALLVKPGYEQPRLVKLGDEKSIQNARQDMDFSTLYNLVWRDLDTLLNGVQTIYYSPAGELNNVSFAALCYQAGDSTLASSENQRNVIWEEQKTKTTQCQGLLLDKYKLHQLTSTRYLADGTLQRANAMTSTIALYGGIHYDDLPEKVTRTDVHKSNEDVAFQLNLDQYKKQNPQNDPRASVRSSSAYGKKMKYLEGTKTEVENIALVTKNKQWKVHTSTALNASEHALKEDLNREMPGVLHIATHGFAFPDLAKRESDMRDLEGNTRYKVSEDPMFRCGLMLSGSNISWTGGAETMIEQTGEDGILTAAEVANLNLTGTKLVVLSACETGLGKIEGTEGTFGLKRGFKLAGVEQIMVSLWSVPDAQTMELMTLFYTDLASTMDPVESFEKAQKEMKQRYPTEPEKWAGFVLVR